MRVFLLMFILAASVVSAEELPLLWRRALGGQIDAYPAQGPSGDVYVVADDRALHSIDPISGEAHWIYRPGGRLRNLLLVAPDGTIYVQNDRQELYAVTPGGTGRWRLRMNTEPAALPAAAPDGRLILPLMGGRIVCVSRHGVILWTVDETADASAGPVVTAQGTAWIPLSDGRLVALDPWGEKIAEKTMPGAVSVLAIDVFHRIWAGGFYGGLMVVGVPQHPGFQGNDFSSRIAGIHTGAKGGGRIFTADGTVVDYDAQGREIRRDRVALSGGSPSAAADGTLYIPVSGGSIRVVPPDGSEGFSLWGGAVLAEPLLTDEGILIAGGGDWILYAWNAAPPGDGWRQFRGGSRRSGAFRVERISWNRLEARKEAGFFFRERMAVSEDLSQRLALLDELETYPNSFQMRRDLPWVDLLLEDLMAVGTIRRVESHASLQSHSLARTRAYGLIAAGEDFRIRELLLSCLWHEDDPTALAAGFRALGQLGTDWDGASTRLIAARYQEIQSADEKLTLETARALSDLVRYNGTLSDSAAYGLIDSLLRSSMSRKAREDVIALIRSISRM